MTAKEESACLKRFKDGDVQARDDLIERNLRLVAHIVKKYSVPGRDTEELISVGIVGLVKAVNTFEVDKGHKIATYAARCIENAILSQMRLWWGPISPEQKRTKMAYSGTGFREYIHPFLGKILQRHHKGIEKSRCSNLQSLFTCFLYGCGFDNCIQQLYFLIGRTIQFFNMLIDQACVDTGNTFCQFTLTRYSFWIMDNYIDWSTLSCDTTHLPRYFNL